LHKNKSKHKPKPTLHCKNCSYVCAYRLHNYRTQVTTHHRTILLFLRRIIIAQMMSTGGQGRGRCRHKKWTLSSMCTNWRNAAAECVAGRMQLYVQVPVVRRCRRLAAPSSPYHDGRSMPRQTSGQGHSPPPLPNTDKCLHKPLPHMTVPLAMRLSVRLILRLRLRGKGVFPSWGRLPQWGQCPAGIFRTFRRGEGRHKAP